MNLLQDKPLTYPWTIEECFRDIASSLEELLAYAQGGEISLGELKEAIQRLEGRGRIVCTYLFEHKRDSTDRKKWEEWREREREAERGRRWHRVRRGEAEKGDLPLIPPRGRKGRRKAKRGAQGDGSVKVNPHILALMKAKSKELEEVRRIEE
jgi:hypothetical protein